MSGEKILIVEDELDIADLMASLMRKNGYQTFVAGNGVRGLELALSEHPDLILLDMRLPQMGGMQLLYKLDEHQMDIPVVVVTAWGSEELAVQALRLGVKDYIKKPFSIDELLHVAERALTEARLRSERDELTEKLLVSNETLESRVHQLTALYEVGQALASTLDPDELLKVILREACRVLDVSLASIFLLDEHSGDLVFRSGMGDCAEMLIGLQLAPGQGVAGWVAQEGRPLLVSDAQADSRFSPIFDQITGLVTESILCVPLMIKGRVIGVVEALNKPEPGFTGDDLAMLRSLAASAAVSIENTQLFEETNRRLRESKVLFRLGKQLTALLPLDDLLQILADGVVELVPKIDGSSIYLRDVSDRDLRVRAKSQSTRLDWDDLAVSDQTVGRALEENRIIVTQLNLKDQLAESGDDASDGSILAVPLRMQEEELGVLAVASLAAQGFSDADQSILTTFANQAAIAFKNARLHRQTEVQLARTTRAYGELWALQETSGVLLSSLDLQDVLNQIVNSVVAVLGYNAAMLAEYDEQTQTLPVKAVAADAALVDTGEEMVGFGVLDAQVTMDQTENLAVRAALAGNIEVTHELYDLFRPLVPQDMTDFIQRAAGIRTMATIPLLAKGRLVGNLFAGTSKDCITDKDLDSLQAFANQAAIAIENARLYQNLRASRDQVAERSDALEKRLSELSRLQQIALELGKVTIGTDHQDVFGRLTEQAATLLEAKSSAIMLFDVKRKELVCQSPAFGVPDDVVQDYCISINQKSPAWTAWESGGPLMINDVANSPLVQALGLEELAQRMDLGATILSMLRMGGQPIGVLQVSDKRDGTAFTPDDERVLEIFSSQGAIAIENARILQRMDALGQVGEAIAARLTLPEVLDRVIQGISELFELEGISIWLTEPGTGSSPSRVSLIAALPDLPRDFKMDYGEGIVGRVAQTGRPMIVHDTQNDPRHSRKIDELLDFVTESVLCVPFQVGNQVGGVIEVVNKIGARFDQEDLEILRSVAASVGIAVENARLFTQEKRRASEMAALVGIAQAVTEGVTERPKELLEHIARGVCQVLEADCAIVYPFTSEGPDTYDMENVAAFGTLQPLDLSQDNVSPRDPTRVICKRNLLVCEDIECDRMASLRTAFFERESIRAFVGVSLEADEDQLGILYVNFRRPYHFEERELTFVRLIAHQAALAIAKSRLFQTLNQDLVRANVNLRRKVRELEELQTINNVISSTLEIDTMMDSVLRGAMSITGAPYAVIMMYEESGAVISHLRQGDETSTKRIGPREMMSVSELDSHQERSTIVQDVIHPSASEIPWTGIYRRLIPSARAFLYTPILGGGEQKHIGFLGIGSPRPDEFGPDDRRLLEALANQAAIAIQNARYLQTVRSYQEQQVETERIAAMADVASNMVHRINNTVGAIRPLVQQVEMKLDRGKLTDSYLTEKLQRIRENANRTLEVARQIQRPFRSIQLEPVDVTQSIEAAWSDMAAPFGVEVSIECGAELPLVKATRQLDEVFRNLIKNALEATAEQGGTVSIRSQPVGKEQVVVVVQDDGPGISPEIRERIFNMGTTTKSGGMGYGLWWSRTFLRRLGGDITLDSEEGQGCTFTVILPVDDKRSADAP